MNTGPAHRCGTSPRRCAYVLPLTLAGKRGVSKQHFPKGARQDWAWVCVGWRAVTVPPLPPLQSKAHRRHLKCQLAARGKY